MSSIAISVS